MFVDFLFIFFFFSSRRRHTRYWRDWSSDVCSSDLDARLCEDQTTRWVEVCYCPSPLLEERPYWEEFFDLTRVQGAHDRRRCRDENGTEPWACSSCDCTQRLERRLVETGESFLDVLRRKVKAGSDK